MILAVTDKCSANAAAILRDAGFRDVHVLRGGMEQWNADTCCRASGSGVEATAHEGASKMMRLLNSIGPAAGAAAAVVPTWVWAQVPSEADRHMYGPPMMWGFGIIFGPLFFILVLALVIGVAVLLVRWLAGSWQGAAPHQVPGRTLLDILRERFARGEIDKDEFEERRRVLGD